MPNKTSSTDIRIFPSSNRAVDSEHYTDNFVTEYNLSSIVNKLLLQNYNLNGNPTSVEYNGVTIPINGFIISTTPPQEDTDKVDFNINGYFVNVSRGAIINAIATGGEGSANTYYQDFIWFDTVNNQVYAFADFTNEVGAEESLRHLTGSDSNGSTDITVSKTVSGSNTVALPLFTSNTCDTFVSTSKLRLTNFAIDNGEF